jgi:tRNA pseudouridine55 synthase
MTFAGSDLNATSAIAQSFKSNFTAETRRARRTFHGQSFLFLRALRVSAVKSLFNMFTVIPVNGIITLNKPAGISSARAVARVKRLLPRGTKIGHAGTLDPFATGVLLLLVGKATKQCERLMGEAKRYEATIKLGATTATLDPESPEEPFAKSGTGDPPVLFDVNSHGRVARATIEQLLRGFIGEIPQRPPAFSAMKVGGQRAYKLARGGHDVQLEPRTVRVYAIELLDYGWPLLRVRIDCGRGTYIRSIARDVGEALGVGGYLTQLRRTRVGAFDVSDAVTLEQLEAGGVERHLHAI